MARYVRPSVSCVALAVALLSAGPALAASERIDGAKAAGARRHVAQVCRPLEVRGFYGRAARCYGDVEAYLAGSLSTPVGAVPSRSFRRFAESRTRIAMDFSQTGHGLAPSSFIFLGVGF